MLNLIRWNHLTNDCLANIHDDLLRAETGLDAVTACFQCASTPLQMMPVLIKGSIDIST